MGEKELRRSLSVLPIGTVMKLTDLTARQIRYYEQQELVIPDRSDGNRRLYSLNDIDKLLEVKDYLASGKGIASIRDIFAEKDRIRKEKQKRLSSDVSDKQMRQLLSQEFAQLSGLSDGSSNPFSPNGLNF